MGRRLEQLEEFGIDVVLERRHGIRASVLRGILYALSFVYDRLVQLRLYLYRKRVLRERALGCLVISIGNLTVGGTGKTPIVEKFASVLQAGGRRVAILSRGYKSVCCSTTDSSICISNIGSIWCSSIDKLLSETNSCFPGARCGRGRAISAAPATFSSQKIPANPILI